MLQGASLVITKDGNSVAYNLTEPSDLRFLECENHMLDVGKEINLFAKLVLKGKLPPVAEDPSDPKESDLCVELRGDHGRGKSVMLYDGSGMSVAQRDWLEEFYVDAAENSGFFVRA